MYRDQFIIYLTSNEKIDSRSQLSFMTILNITLVTFHAVIFHKKYKMYQPIRGHVSQLIFIFALKSRNNISEKTHKENISGNSDDTAYSCFNEPYKNVTNSQRPLELLRNAKIPLQIYKETDLVSLIVLEKKQKISPPISLGGHVGFYITLEITTLLMEHFSLYHTISSHSKQSKIKLKCI